MGKGKKGNNKQVAGNANNNAQNAPENEPQVQKLEPSKQQQMSKIMNALQNLDLDNADFIDTKSFDQSKAILQNAIEDLQHYLKLFQKSEFEKFPKVKLTQ